MFRYQVAILANESTQLPLVEDTVGNFLTQFFLSLRARLHTSILVNSLASTIGQKRGVQNKIELVDRDGYTKEFIETVAQFKNQNAEVVILLCHGLGKDDKQNPAALFFRCTGADEGYPLSAAMVYAKPFEHPTAEQKDVVTLHDVIGECKLAIMLACAGDDLRKQYVFQARKKQAFPDILICNDVYLSSVTVEIYMVLLVNILDSLLDVKGFQFDIRDYIALPDGSVYEYVRQAIIRIFQIVQLFGDDSENFWSFLKHVGCIVDNVDEKNRQQLVYPRKRLGKESRFRVYGRAWAVATQKCAEEVLDDFKHMELIYWNTDGTEPKPFYVDCDTVTPMTWQESSDTNIDLFLKTYAQSKAASSAGAKK